MEAKIDSAGRVLIPKAIRESLGIDAGDCVEIQVKDRSVTLRPKQQGARSLKKKGFTVFQSHLPLREDAVDETIRRVRQEREDRILGNR